MKNLKDIQNEINEGANATNPSAVFSELIKVLDDSIKGFAGKNGSNDPKHPEGTKINKNLRDALKLIKVAKRELKSKDEKIWLTNIIKESEHTERLQVLESVSAEDKKYFKDNKDDIMKLLDDDIFRSVEDAIYMHKNDGKLPPKRQKEIDDWNKQK